MYARQLLKTLSQSTRFENTVFYAVAKYKEEVFVNKMSQGGISDGNALTFGPKKGMLHVLMLYIHVNIFIILTLFSYCSYIEIL